MKKRWLALIAAVALVASVSSASLASSWYDGSDGGVQTQGIIRPTGIW